MPATSTLYIGADRVVVSTLNGPPFTMRVSFQRTVVHELGHALKGYVDFGERGWAQSVDNISNWSNPIMKELGYTLMRDPMSYQSDVYLNQNAAARMRAVPEY